MRTDARRATKVVAGTTKPRRTRAASHLRSCAAKRAAARRFALACAGQRSPSRSHLHAPASTTQTPHFAATRRDGAIRAHGIVVCRWFGLYQTALLTPRPAPGLHTVATAWDLIRGSLDAARGIAHGFVMRAISCSIQVSTLALSSPAFIPAGWIGLPMLTVMVPGLLRKAFLPQNSPELSATGNTVASL